MRHEKGMLLLELLVALSLFGLIVSAVMTVYWTAFAVFEKQAASADVQYSARHAREAIIKEFSASRSFTVRSVRYGNEVAAGDAGHCLYLVQDGKTVEFYVHNHQLFQNNSNASPNPIAEFISNISFSPLTSHSISICVEAQSQEQAYTLNTICNSRVE